MEMNEFNESLRKLYDGEELSDEELKALDYEAASLVDQMASGELDYDKQNALDLYVQYFDDSRYLDQTKTSNVMKYYATIEEKHNKKLEAEKESSPKVLTKKPLNSDGIISAITIIEVVVVLGMVISFIAIALLRK